MCALEDLINSTTSSADSMTSTLKDYGNDSMGGGIRKAVDESYSNGYNDCFDTEVPKAYDKGYNDCLETEVPKAHDDGKVEGVIIGSIVTLCVVTAICCGKKLVCYVKGKIHAHKAKKNDQKESEGNK